MCPVKANPEFTNRPFFNVQAGRVQAIEAVSSLDIVFIEGGASQGFRAGMVCEVFQSSSVVGEVILIEVSPESSAALILNLKPNQSLEAGDTLRIKTRPVTDFTR